MQTNVIFNQRPEADEKVIDERATWLDTRDLEDSFVDLVELSLHQVRSTCLFIRFVPPVSSSGVFYQSFHQVRSTCLFIRCVPPVSSSGAFHFVSTSVAV